MSDKTNIGGWIEIDAAGDGNYQITVRLEGKGHYTFPHSVGLQDALGYARWAGNQLNVPESHIIISQASIRENAKHSIESRRAVKRLNME